ncbi:hypothetical protein DFH06DRAFT_1323656 [Mycena polygramma]|nr:hypothetical protein DFH06DRAFT_1323656 [Mycena polygramma]
MGRKLIGLIEEEERERYWRALRDPHGVDAQLFRAPTSDPMVAFARRQLDPTSSRAVEEIGILLGAVHLSARTPLPVSGPNSPADFRPESPLVFADTDALTRVPTQEVTEMLRTRGPLQPLYAAEGTVPASISHLVRVEYPASDVPSSSWPTTLASSRPQSLINSSLQNQTTHRTADLQAGLAMFPPNMIGVPVAWADSVSGPTTETPRYAVLGPAESGFVQRDRLLRLTNADGNTVVLRRNHGTGPSKPLCTVIEAEYEIDGATRSLILLAASFLVHPTFAEEVSPNTAFVGDISGYRLLDRWSTSFVPYSYGVSLRNYQELDHDFTSFTDTAENEWEADSERGTNP